MPFSSRVVITARIAVLSGERFSKEQLDERMSIGF
jgi:hypothetical protein